MGNMSGSYGSHYTLRQVITVNSQSIDNNVSNVTARMYLDFDGSSYYAYTNNPSSGSMIINGSSFNYSISNISFSSGVAKSILLAEWTGDIAHNTDGTKVLEVSGNWNTNISRIGSGSCSASITLSTIPRASSISCTTANVTEPAIITINSASPSFWHRVWVDFGNLIEVVISQVQYAGSFSWTIPENFYNQMPNSKSKTGRIYCRTYSGQTEIGLKVSDFTVTTNEQKCKPSLSATVTDINEQTIDLTDDNQKLIKHKSTAKISISTTAKNGASISSKKVNNTLISENNMLIQEVETDTFLVTVTDSRGYSNSITLKPELIDYIPLTINATIKRTQPTTGEIDLSFSGNYFNGILGNVDNTLEIEWFYKEKGSENWISGGTIEEQIIDNNTYNNGDSVISLGKNFDYQKAYEFYLGVKDKLTILQPTFIVTQGIPIFDWGKNFVNVNGDLQINEQSILPKVLYENKDGLMNGNATLKDDLSNYKRFKITYGEKDVNERRIYEAEVVTNNHVLLQSEVIDANTRMYIIRYADLTIKGTNITINYNSYVNINHNANPYVGNPSTATDYIAIYQIIGYKEN